MIPLETAAVPATADQWRDALTDALRQRLSGTPTVAVDGTPPALDRLDVDLSNCELADDAPPDLAVVAPGAGRLTVRQLRLAADPLTVRGVPLAVDAHATDPAFDLGRNAAGQLIAMLAQATDGRVTVRLTPDAIDAALLMAARSAAADHGVDIRAVRATLTARTPRELDVVIDATVKKFVTFPLRLAGRLSIDDALTATASALTVTGSGMAATAAAAVLRPQLRKLEGQTVPLLSYTLGDVRLRDVAVDTTDGLRVTATFG